jgi:FAD synthase
MRVSGQVVRGRQYQDKVPTANILMDKPVLAGVYIGGAYDIDGVGLGRSFVFITDYAKDIAETYITGYNSDLYGEFLSVENMVRLKRKDLIELYDTAMKEWENRNVPILS